MTNTTIDTRPFYSIRLHNPDTGRVLVISPSPEAHLRLLEDGLDGFGATELLVKTEPYADGTGGHPVTRRFGERYLGITAEINGEEWEIRQRICALMNPQHTLEMEITLSGITRRLDVIPCGKPEFRQANFYTPTEVYLPFLAPDPFYRAAEETEVLFWKSMPLMAFPLNFWKGAGMTAGYRRISGTTAVYNPGDAPCGFDAWLTAAGGPVENPILQRGDRYIRLHAVLESGQTAHIDTRPRQRNVWIDGERRFTFHRDSDFFLLEPGENEICVTADAGAEFLSAKLRYTPLYYGI